MRYQRYQALHTEQVARIEHECAWGCGSPIKRGHRYIRASLPPNVGANEGPGWWTIRMHGHTQEACPTVAYSDVDPRTEGAERTDLRCRPKAGFATGEVYCSRHGRAAGWPCTWFATPAGGVL